MIRTVAVLVAALVSAGCNASTSDGGVTVANAPTTSPSKQAVALVARLNRGGFKFSVSEYVRNYPGTSSRPHPTIVGPADLTCLHGADTQVNVSAYNSVAQRKQADKYFRDLGVTVISGGTWNITVTDGSDAAVIARIMR